MTGFKPVCMLIVISLLAGGCASGTKRDTSNVDTAYVLSQDQQIGSVAIALTPEAKKQSVENLKFDAEELRKHVERALEVSELLNEPDKGKLPGVIIEVKEIRVRSNFTAVMFGFMAGADSITGDIVIQDPAGSELDRFEVSVDYALGGLAGGQDTARVSWLYEKFAEETINELKGQR